MKNLNIYTFRELIKMYLDDRPMPDVAFVTQTEAMKLQSMGKEMNNNSEWITDRRPTEEDACKDADPVLYECVIVQGRDNKLYRKWYNVTSGEAWQCIPWENADEPIAKAKRSAAMSEWITDRRPTAEEAHDLGQVWVTAEHGNVLRQLWNQIGDRPWMPITPPGPYVKPSRFEIYGAVGGWQVWGVRDNNGFDIIGFISRDHAKWAVEQLEKVIP